MGKEISILHVASFTGNVGDNASHAGFYQILNQIVGAYKVEKLEMRKFYMNYKGHDKRTFDSQFIDYANSFDLVVFGGGGFLDYWIPDSSTGTTIDMAPEIVKNLKVQTLITSMGSLPKKQVPEGNIVKYKNFLDAVFANDNIKIAVRNDGSRHAIKNDLGEAYSSRIDEVLDSGFFYSINDQEKKLVKEKDVAINAATDQVQLLAERDSGFSENRFYDELALSINKIIYRLGMHVVLVPHVHGDLKAINTILGRLNDYDTRKHVSVGPCVQGDRGANSIFSLYKHSHCIVASRLHANVCAMAMHKNVIGLPVLDRVKSIHQSVGSDQFVSVHEPFSEAILSGIECFEIGPKVKETIEKRKRETLDFYRTQLKNFS